MAKKMPLREEPVKGKVCWSCVHMNFWPGEPGYSEYTPGSDFRMYCGKYYWEFDNDGDYLKDFRRKLESAEKCADFTGRKD